MGEKRPYMWGLVALGSVALLTHLVGFVTPGWIVLERSVIGFDESMFNSPDGQLIDEGGVRPPDEFDDGVVPELRRKRHGDDWEDSSSDEDHHGSHGMQENGWERQDEMGDSMPEEWPHHGSHGGHHRPPHHGGGSHHSGHRPGPKPGQHHGPHHPTGRPDPNMMMENLNKAAAQWMKEDMGMDDDDDDSSEEHMSEEDWAEDDEEDRKRSCKCKKMSTEDALQLPRMHNMYDEDFMSRKNGKYLSPKNFGHASLLEHRIECCFILAFMVLGVISAVAGFRKADGCRYARVACVVFMLVAGLTALVPVSRFSHFSAAKAHSDFIHVRAPYSAISVGVAALFSLLTAFVAGCGVMTNERKNLRQGRGWYQFQNELGTEKKENPGIYVSTDPLPAKPGLYDVCDFSNIKPVEEIKRPEPEIKSGEFIM